MKRRHSIPPIVVYCRIQTLILIYVSELLQWMNYVAPLNFLSTGWDWATPIHSDRHMYTHMLKKDGLNSDSLSLSQVSTLRWFPLSVSGLNFTVIPSLCLRSQLYGDSLSLSQVSTLRWFPLSVSGLNFTVIPSLCLRSQLYSDSLSLSQVSTLQWFPLSVSGLNFTVIPSLCLRSQLYSDSLSLSQVSTLQWFPLSVSGLNFTVIPSLCLRSQLYSDSLSLSQVSTLRWFPLSVSGLNFTVIPSLCLRSQLLDIATAAQTEASREALLELLNFEDEEAVDHSQRFLFAAAYSSHPSETLIADLLVR